MRKLALRAVILLVAAAPVLGAPLAVSVGDQTAAGVQMGVALANMPNYEWWYGCSPTSTGMMMGYYDRNGYRGVSYANLVPGAVACRKVDLVCRSMARGTFRYHRRQR